MLICYFIKKDLYYGHFLDIKNISQELFSSKPLRDACTRNPANIED